MKKIKYIVRLYFILIICTACAGNVTRAEFKSYEIEETKDENTNSEKSQETIGFLQPSDFAVTDGQNEIVLDRLYGNMELDKPEITEEAIYVGEIYGKNGVYQYYVHEYEDLTIYISNANWNLKDRKADDYYTAQIELNNTVFRTFRGITIGSSMEDVIEAYGQGIKYVTDDGCVLNYTYNDLELYFTIDQSEVVQGVSMHIGVTIDEEKENTKR